MLAEIRHALLNGDCSASLKLNNLKDYLGNNPEIKNKLMTMMAINIEEVSVEEQVSF